MTATNPRKKPAARQPKIFYAMPPTSEPSSSSMAVLETKVDALVRQGHDTNETLRSLTRAVTQLAVIEERQTADRQAVDRAFNEIKSLQTAVDKLERDTENRIGNVSNSLDSRLKTLETKAPVNDLSNGMVAKVVGVVISAVVGGAMVLVLRQPTPQAPVVIQQGTPSQVQQAPRGNR